MRGSWSIGAGAWRTIACVGLVAGGVGLLTTYLFHMSLATQRGFALRTVEEQVGDLRVRREFLEAKLAERERLTRVQERVNALGFVRPARMTFLNQHHTVAVR